MNALMLIGAGGLGLYLLSQNKANAAAVTSDLQGKYPLDLQSKKDLVLNSAIYVPAAEAGLTDPVYNLSGIKSYANYLYVQNALVALGYDINTISKDAINACVYRVSVYAWYYYFMAIGTKDDSKLLTDEGAFSVIDSWISTQFGYSKITGIGTPYYRYPERNRLAKYNPNIKQDMYISGGIGVVEIAVEQVIEWALQLFSFAAEQDWWGLFDKPNDLCAEWLMDQGMDEATAIDMTNPIYPGHDYWTAAVNFHIYLVYHPSFMPEFTPVYKP